MPCLGEMHPLVGLLVIFFSVCTCLRRRIRRVCTWFFTLAPLSRGDPKWINDKGVFKVVDLSMNGLLPQRYSPATAAAPADAATTATPTTAAAAALAATANGPGAASIVPGQPPASGCGCKPELKRRLVVK